jgi:hypothetical protein
MAAKDYDANEVTITWANRLINSGFDDGEFCKIVQNADDFSIKVGSDGSVSRSAVNNKTLTIEIKLLQTSPGCAFFSQMRRIKGVGAFFLRDRKGFSITTATEAWISKLPEQSWARDPNARVWTLQTGPADVFIGGNNDVAQQLIG